MIHTFAVASGVAAGTSVLLLALLVTFQDRILYYKGPCLPFARRRDVAVEDVWFETRTGVRIHGWFAACPQEFPTAVPGERPVVLFCRGNGGTLPRWRWVVARWQDALGADVLLFDYAGYGESGGTTDEASVHESAQAAYAWLVEKRGVDARRVVLVGQSLGGGPAVELATTRDHRLLVLESTFTSVPDIVDSWSFMLLGRFARGRFPNEKRLAGYKKPLFLSHGDWDLLIGLSQAKRLKAAAAGPVELMVFPGMGHHDDRPAAYEAAVRRFVTASW